MDIRKLSVNDYEEMTRLWARADLPFKPTGRDSRDAIAAEVKANPDFFLGAFEGNRLVGVAIITCDLRKGWINRLAVDPDCRGLGIGKALINECEETLGKRGIKIFCALIEASNTMSRALFRECGYVEHSDILYFSKRDSSMI
jgi:ribosomal protein S18 acetylase RimI-like enzyme